MTIAIDETSLLLSAPGSATLAAVEAELTKSGLTLDVAGASGSNETVASWLARGAPGTRDSWLDPADHLVAGAVLALHGGPRVDIRAAPRRAVGPDLLALAVGMGGRFCAIERVSLRVHRTGAKRPDVGALRIEMDPPLSDEEARLLDAIATSLPRR
jgi:alkyldihydroxyacetonephosphate synthase